MRIVSRAISLLERNQGDLRRELARTARGLAQVADGFRRHGLSDAALSIEQAIDDVRRARKNASKRGWHNRRRAKVAIEEAYAYLEKAFQVVKQDVEGRPRFAQRLVDAMHWIGDLRGDLADRVTAS